MEKNEWLSSIARVKKNLHKKVKQIILCTLVGFISVAQADIAVIVNPVNSGVSLKMSDVQAIFLGLQTKLPNGATVVPFDQAEGQAIRQTFYQLVAGKNSVEMKTYWSRLNFTGRATPPTVLSDSNAVRAKVASDKNAIGYVDASLAKNTDSVSIALLIPTH
jgi:ABC-type phosphate transport system substrate-binding protein